MLKLKCSATVWSEANNGTILTNDLLGLNMRAEGQYSTHLRYKIQASGTKWII